MFIESYSFVETMDTFAQSVEVGSNSVIKDLYAYRLTRNKWTTFIMVTQDNKREFLGC